MDCLKKLTNDDLKLLAKRELRQKQESQRKERIFNPRTRIIGIDKHALDEGIRAKKQREVNERNEELAYAKELQTQCNIINCQLKELKIEQSQLDSEMNEFRLRFQQKNQTRDFDLNDPECLKKTSPFDGLHWLGEDSMISHRKYLQKLQLKSWLLQQIDEQKQIKDNTTKANIETAQMMATHDQRLKEIQESENRLRHEIYRKTALYNMELAQQKESKAIQLKKQCENDNLAEILNHLTSDMLLETKEIAMTSNLLGSNRICVDMYRGMTDEQLQAIRFEQKCQIEEKQRKLADEKEMNARYIKSVRARFDMLAYEDEQKQKQRQQMLCEQNMINAQLRDEQKQRNQYLNKELYTFTPSEEYFDQFNTTTR